MLDLLKALCTLPGVSGAEDAVRDYILERAMGSANEISTDPMGNVLVFKKGRSPAPQRLLLCAHMDEVGLMVTYIEEKGYLKFAFVGGIDRRVVIGKRVCFQNGVSGVIGQRAVHQLSPEEKKKVPKPDDLCIDIGVSCKEEAEALVQIGDTAWFDSTPVSFGSGCFKARAIDDRAGCAVLLRLLAEDLPVDCRFAFTVQEEVGCRGAAIAASRIKPELALVLEGTTAADLPEVPEHKRICAPGKGVVLPFMDHGTIYDKGLQKRLAQLADAHGIPWQTKRYVAGGTDASSIQRSGVGVRTAALAVPVRNIHTPACVIHEKDFEHMYTLTRLFLEDLAR